MNTTSRSGDAEQAAFVIIPAPDGGSELALPAITAASGVGVSELSAAPVDLEHAKRAAFRLRALNLLGERNEAEGGVSLTDLGGSFVGMEHQQSVEEAGWRYLRSLPIGRQILAAYAMSLGEQPSDRDPYVTERTMGAYLEFEKLFHAKGKPGQQSRAQERTRLASPSADLDVELHIIDARLAER